MALTHDEWRDRLLKRFAVDVPNRVHYQSVYDSTQSRIDPVPKYRAAYARLMKMARTPWARLVVDLTEERLHILGIESDDDMMSDLLWALLRDSKIEAVQDEVYREALTVGTSYLSVWPSELDPTQPIIRAESSLEVVHETMPGESYDTAAALKVWIDDIAGMQRCNLYTHDAVVRFAAPWKGESSGGFDLTNSKWDTLEIIEHSYGYVPIVPFVVRPDYRGYGRSDLADLEETIQRIEYLTANTLLAVELGAFRQKWATGLEVPVDPDTSTPVEPYKAALDRLWVSEDPDTKFGSFQDTDIRPYLSAISDAIGQLSAVSRVPPTYFVQSDLSNPPSAASLEASETGLISKIKQRQNRFGESWEIVTGIVAAIVDVPLDTTKMRMRWRDPRTRSDSQTMDAAVKLDSIGVPFRSVMEFVGYTAEQIARMESYRADDAFMRALDAAASTVIPPIEEPAARPVGG